VAYRHRRALYVLLPYFSAICQPTRVPTKTRDDGFQIQVCSERKVCVVSSNKPTEHDPQQPFWKLVQRCVEEDKDTEIIVLALQDYYPDIAIPGYIPENHQRDFLQVKEGGKRFKLRHQLVTEGTGHGRLCYHNFAGGMAAMAIAGAAVGAKAGFVFKGIGAIPGFIIGGLTGAVLGKTATTKLGGPNCGGVALIVYSLKHVDVKFDLKDLKSWRATARDQSHIFGIDLHATASTKKGTVAAALNIDGRKVVVASTHATEGIRGKKKGTCTKIDSAHIGDEMQRVTDFRQGMNFIKELRESGGSDLAAIWAGDFNQRSADPETGCAHFPTVSQEVDYRVELQVLQDSRDILGAFATFTAEMNGTGLREIHGLKCPTYKKDPVDKEVPEGLDRFRCSEGGEEMYYLNSHPPSWADRIFATTESPWLHCGRVQRISHQTDHDAIFVVCTVRAGECGK